MKPKKGKLTASQIGLLRSERIKQSRSQAKGIFQQFPEVSSIAVTIGVDFGLEAELTLTWDRVAVLKGPS